MQQTMKIGNRLFDLQQHTYIMAILNMTPDSFSDGGSYKTLDDALYRVEQMLAEGADIIDIGGESTRPGHTAIGDEEEINRVTPIIEAVTKRFDVPVSIDSYKAPVVKAALASGAHLVNDIWGLQHDAEMATVIAQAGATCCLMHNKHNTQYDNILVECLESLRRSAERAVAAGVPRENIMLDPRHRLRKNLRAKSIFDAAAEAVPFVRLSYAVRHLPQIDDWLNLRFAGGPAGGRHSSDHCAGGAGWLELCAGA